MLVENRLDLLVLDKLIEPFAPTSPGGIETEENAFVFARGFGFGFGQEPVGSGSSLSSRAHGDKKQW